MPTLSAMFRLMDGYSTTINKFIGKVDAASTKTLGASKNTDKLNDSMDRTGRVSGAAYRPMRDSSSACRSSKFRDR